MQGLSTGCKQMWINCEENRQILQPEEKGEKKRKKALTGERKRGRIVKRSTERKKILTNLEWLW